MNEWLEKKVDTQNQKSPSRHNYKIIVSHHIIKVSANFSKGMVRRNFEVAVATRSAAESTLIRTQGLGSESMTVLRLPFQVLPSANDQLAGKVGIFIPAWGGSLVTGSFSFQSPIGLLRISFSLLSLGSGLHHHLRALSDASGSLPIFPGKSLA